MNEKYLKNNFFKTYIIYFWKILEKSSTKYLLFIKFYLKNEIFLLNIINAFNDLSPTFITQKKKRIWTEIGIEQKMDEKCFKNISKLFSNITSFIHRSVL